jgi:hypothetical protein
MARWVATKLPRPCGRRGIPLDGFMAWHGVRLGAAAEGGRDEVNVGRNSMGVGGAHDDQAVRSPRC